MNLIEINFSEVSELFESLLSSFCKDNLVINILISGGTTPIPIYESFKQYLLPWERIHFWLADERCYPMDHPERNQNLIKGAFGEDLVSKTNFHWIADREHHLAVDLYAHEIKSVEVFDLAILGIGEDGHTASLFPGNFLGDSEDSPDVLPVLNSPKLPSTRITLSLNKINQTDHVIILAKGSSKMKIINEILNGNDLPAAKVKGKLSTTIYYLTDNL